MIAIISGLKSLKSLFTQEYVHSGGFTEAQVNGRLSLKRFGGLRMGGGRCRCASVPPNATKFVVT